MVSIFNTVRAAKYSDVRKASLEALGELIKKTKSTTQPKTTSSPDIHPQDTKLLQPHVAWIKEEVDEASNSDVNVVPLCKQLVEMLPVL